MRLKTFHAKSMKEVMEQIRQTLGPDAIIISSDESSGSVRVTAALEAGITPEAVDQAPATEPAPPTYELAHAAPITKDFDPADVMAVLRHHGIPTETASRLIESIESMEVSSLVDAFSRALDACTAFSPLTDKTTRPILLVGPGGVGKTICAAKLTANALLHQRTVKLISIDTIKAGGISQLDHFAQLMRQTVLTAETPEELAALLKNTDGNVTTIIDSFGVNPFDMDEVGQLLKFIHQIDAEPVLVLPAGLEPYDAQEMAEIFAKLGCQRFIATRLDVARRYGGIVMAARPKHLALAAISRSPYVAEGLEPASPTAFARLLTALPKPMSDKALSRAS